MNLIIEPVTSFFTAVVNGLASSFGLLANDNSDGRLGLVMSALAGVAAALAVAIMLAVYLRTGYRTGRDMVRHGLAAAAALGLLAFAAYDMRHAAPMRDQKRQVAPVRATMAAITQSSTESCWKTWVIWKAQTMPARAMRCGRRPVMSRPAKTMRPALGRMKPASR